MLGLLVWVDASGATLRRRGDGWADVEDRPAAPDGPLWVAHPVDLAAWAASTPRPPRPPWRCARRSCDVVSGTLGEYSVHLGSGTVHRRPGGALRLIPVDAQRRGRVFLPVVDDDPVTAEVGSKVLLLAQDSTIKAPTVLEQLRS